MGIMQRHARARHASAYVPGYALDRGAQRVNLSGAVERYGRHGVLPHLGERETRAQAILRAVRRTLRGAYRRGVHGSAE